MAIVRAFPQFSGGNILRNEMLLSLRGYAELGDLLYEGYGDGILSGCKLTTTREAIHVGRGVIVQEGKLLMLKEPLKVPYYPTDTLCACKLRFSAEHSKDNVLYQEVEAVITEDVETRQDEMELCRFKLQPGAMLRSEYVDFEDRSTEYDTLNTIYSPFSVLGGSTLSLDIVQAFALELMQCSPSDTIDQIFCIHTLEAQKAMPLEAITGYIKIRASSAMEHMTPVICYKWLLKIIKSAKGETELLRDNLNKSRWSVVLD